MEGSGFSRNVHSSEGGVVGAGNGAADKIESPQGDEFDLLTAGLNFEGLPVDVADTNDGRRTAPVFDRTDADAEQADVWNGQPNG